MLSEDEAKKKLVELKNNNLPEKEHIAEELIERLNSQLDLNEKKIKRLEEMVHQRDIMIDQLTSLMNTHGLDLQVMARNTKNILKLDPEPTSTQ